LKLKINIINTKYLIKILKASAIGANSLAAQAVLKTDWKDTFKLDDGIKLAIKILSKTMDSTSLTSEKCKFVFFFFFFYLHFVFWFKNAILLLFTIFIFF